MDKDLRKLLKAITDAGYVVVYSRKGHPMVYTQDGEYVTSFAGTGSDWRGELNGLRELRKRGFHWRR
jgi:hypothetical protein